MSTVDRSPTPFGQRLAVVAALLAVVLAGAGSWTGLALGLVGGVVLAAGARLGRRSAVTAGGVVLFAAAFAAGVDGVAPTVVLAAAVATVVAWDAATNAISLGEQLGTAAPTARREAVHVGATALVGVTTATVGVVVFELVAGGAPVTALFFLLLAAVFVAIRLR